MKTFWTIVLGLFLLVGCDNSDDDPMGNWVKKNDFEGHPRGSAVSFVIGDKAYVGLGYNDDDDTNDGYLKDFWEYNSLTDKWKSIAAFPGNGRTFSVGFSIKGKGYIGTGFDGTNKLQDIWEYNPTTDVWTQKDNFIGGKRYKAVGFAIDNYGYIGTGYGEDAVDKNDFYRFDPTAASGSQWVKVQSIGGSKRHGATAFTYDGKAYVCTGVNNGVSLTDMEEYNPTTDTWTKKVELDDDDDWTITRQEACSLVFDGKAYVFLGETSGGSALGTIWQYDFTGDTWTELSEFEGSARYNAVAFTVGDKAIVGAGQTGSYYLDDVWEWRPYEESDTDD
jgi:N-acetylneuraminic acid mutarotase